jgi:enediyne biosynthesis thioesterase
MHTQYDVANVRCEHGNPAEPYFAYRRTVSLEETNATGNVYFSQYVKWQGHCRELFLKVTGDWVVRELGNKYALVTTWCHCDYFVETEAFDDICMHLWMSEVRQNRMTLQFEYWRVSGERDELVARGGQQIAWLQRGDDDRMHARPIPQELLDSIEDYIAAKFGTTLSGRR